jgi:hypothetical protein
MSNCPKVLSVSADGFGLADVGDDGADRPALGCDVAGDRAAVLQVGEDDSDAFSRWRTPTRGGLRSGGGAGDDRDFFRANAASNVPTKRGVG